MNKLLSIVIPAYNTGIYLRDLLDILHPQITEEVECIVIDDSTDGMTFNFEKDFPNVIYKRRQPDCVASARNCGINNTTGKYIAFIDSDDLVVNNYVDIIINKIKIEDFDYCFISWKYIKEVNPPIIIYDNCPEWNWTVWNRVWRRDFIGQNRFNENRYTNEDAEFISAILGGNNSYKYNRKNIVDILYAYRTDRYDNLSSLANRGEIKEFKD